VELAVGIFIQSTPERGFFVLKVENEGKVLLRRGGPLGTMAGVPKPIEAGPIIFMVLLASMGGLGFYQLVYLPYLAPRDICVQFPEVCNPPEKVQARIVLNSFIPTNPENYVPKLIVIFIGVNNTVTWTNEDIAAHTVTSDEGLFDSRLFQPGESWTYTFKFKGVYAYHCTPHPWMKGRVVVCDSAGCPGS
jgi:hypothetical protein